MLKAMLKRLMALVRAEGVEVRRLALAPRYTDREESERFVNGHEIRSSRGCRSRPNSTRVADFGHHNSVTLPA